MKSGSSRYRRLLEGLARRLNRHLIYPMVLGPWELIGVPGTLQAVVDSGYFKRFLKPQCPDLGGIRRVVVVAPHQDDEAIGCGGLLALLKSTADVTVIFLTDGAQGKWGESTAHEIEIREIEARRALAHCDARAVFLGLANGSFSHGPATVAALKAALGAAESEPQLVLAPWLFDRPWKHRAANLALHRALSEMGWSESVAVWGYQVHNVLFPNIVVDISSVVDIKQAMIGEYRSQLENVAPYDHFILGLNQWNAQYLPGGRRNSAEVFFGLSLGGWLDLVETTILPRAEDYLACP